MSYRFSMSEREKKLKEAKERYDQFVEEELDKKQIADYFEIGLKAKVFRTKEGKILKANENLMWGFFDNRGYQYTLRRRPIG